MAARKRSSVVTSPDEGEVTEPAGGEPTAPPEGEVTEPAGGEQTAPPEGDTPGPEVSKPETTEELLARLTSEEVEPVDVEPTTVVMQVAITGTRDGEKWPGIGEEIDVPADEADRMVRLGYARWPD